MFDLITYFCIHSMCTSHSNASRMNHHANLRACNHRARSPCFSSPPLVSLSFQINHYTHPLHPNLQSCLKSICQLLSAVTSMPVSSFVVVIGFWWLARCCGLGSSRIRRRRCDRIGADWPWVSQQLVGNNPVYEKTTQQSQWLKLLNGPHRHSWD